MILTGPCAVLHVSSLAQRLSVIRPVHTSVRGQLARSGTDVRISGRASEAIPLHQRQLLQVGFFISAAGITVAVRQS